MEKVVIVTALFGAYDSELIEIDYDRSKFDFICFTDQKRLKSKTWQMKYVDELPVPNDNPRSSYYYKTLPHRIFPEYNISVWVDSSIWKLNMSALEAHIKRFEATGKALAIEQHPGRQNIYQELQACIRMNKDDVPAMIRHVEGYRKEGLPEQHQLVETGYQLRFHNNPQLIEFQELLWHEMITKTRRDQLSWGYCAWKLNFNNYNLFTFQEKSQILQFKDHPHQPNHKEKVAVIGPWLGEEQWEERIWVPYIKSIIERKPFDRVIVVTRPNHEKYYDFPVDEFKLSDPQGKQEGCLFEGQEPIIKTKNSEDKEVITISPTKNICNQVLEARRKQSKVFVIGMFKTGTTSLGKALELLGYKTLNGPWWFTGDNLKDSFNERPEIWKTFYPQIKAMIERYDAFQDFPWMYLYKELEEWYPNAKFIYMTRDPQKLVKSEVDMWKRSGSTEDEIPPAQKFIDRYENHRKGVEEHFKGKDNFLKMSIIDDGDGWEKLCDFLRLPTPKIEFPHANKGSYKSKKQKFIVAMTGAYAEKYIDRSLQSIINQRGVDFELNVVLDDSGDKTYELAKKYESDKVRVHLNPKGQRGYQLANTIKGINMSNPSDEDIIVMADADDWFAHNNVLLRIEEEYNKGDVWMTHGSWMDYPVAGSIPNNSRPYTREEFQKGVRRCLFRASHIRTFKYKVFKEIPDHYFRNGKGEYFDSACDTALMYPMMEYAGFDRIRFIPDILYIYNRETNYNEDKVMNHTQMKNVMEVVNKTPFVKGESLVEKGKRISLVDRTFPHGKTMMNYNFKEFESNIIWDRQNLTHDIICFTDFTLGVVNQFRNKIKMAMLIEPKSIFPDIYQIAPALKDHFDYILTFDENLISLGKPFVKYIAGGSWIEPRLQNIYKKTKQVSMIASRMNRTAGHKLRHEVAQKLGKNIDLYGKAYKEIPLKVDALKDYRYSVTIENARIKNYFTEKLIDCFLTGTIPIYYGCPNIEEYGFDMNGIIKFNTVDELATIGGQISESDYNSRMDAVKKNFEVAKKYMVTENWIYENILKKEGLIEEKKSQETSNKKIIYHKRGHLGDCVNTLHYIKRLCSENENMNIDFYIKPEYLSELSLMIDDDIKGRVSLFDVRNYVEGSGCNAWYGELKNHRELCERYPHDEFFIRWFEIVSKNLGVKNPFKENKDFLMDNKNILKKNGMSKKYDFMVVNSDTLSGQVAKDDNSFGEMIDHLAKKYSIITTKKYKNYPCTRDSNLALIDIANLSLDCDRIVSVATAPFILCLNKWAIETCKEFFLICNLFEFRYDLGHPEKFKSYRCIEECKNYIIKNF